MPDHPIPDHQLSDWLLFLFSIGYIGLLFLLAYLGDKKIIVFRGQWRGIIYALSLTVYCSSWSFLGTAAQASTDPLAHLPIYLGPILLFLFAWPLIQRMIRVSHKLRITSIADLIAARFGKSQPVAMLVTVVALFGTTPYIALQIKAIVQSWLTVAPDSASPQFAALVVVSLLAGFTLAFGLRNISVTERHPGLMLAIAFESLLKLGAFIIVGGIAIFLLLDSPSIDVQRVAQQSIDNIDLSAQLPSFMASLVMVMAAFLCLPRQFQVMVVECRSPRDTRSSRWLFPLYLLVFALFAIPIGLAGKALLSSNVAPDSYALLLPSVIGADNLIILSFLGTISAASSMVIVSVLALVTMISNELLMPLLFRRGDDSRNDSFNQFSSGLLNLRRSLIVAVIVLGYFAYYLSPPDTLATLGNMAFGALAQLAPALLAAFYWPKANRTGVTLGLILGLGCWLTLLVFPHFGWIEIPKDPMGIATDSAASVTLLSLMLNVFGLWLGSQISRPNVIERIQIGQFLEHHEATGDTPKHKQVTRRELQALAARFIGERKALQSFADLKLQLPAEQLKQPQVWLNHTERLLAGVMGSSSASLLLNSLIEGRELLVDDVAKFVEDASSERLQFSQAMLQGAIDNAGEGISVIDEHLRLVAWNQRYIDLFNYPDELLKVGQPVEKLIRFNAERGFCGDGDIEQQIKKRLYHLSQRTPHTSERQLPNGRVIRIQGNPMPNSGFVMTFSDITDFRRAENFLKAANEVLEQRVQARTSQLESANQELAQQKKIAERAHTNKSQYMRAVSHDLMQPLEAARLFASALQERHTLSEDQLELMTKLTQSLGNASVLLQDLVEVAQIESGKLKPQLSCTSLVDLLSSLVTEFSALACKYQIDFRHVPSQLSVTTDAKMLRRILQNLLGNAFRYAHGGKVLLGVRRQGKQLQIQVIDNGPGIEKELQSSIFEPFTRVQQQNTTLADSGLGLGLSIAKGMVGLMKHTITLRSQPQQGCCFAITVPICSKQTPSQMATAVPSTSVADLLAGATVLCVDNEPAVLQGMTALLEGWGCHVLQADNPKQAIALASEQTPQLMLVDYQLEAEMDGLSLMDQIRLHTDVIVPGVLITAAGEPGLAQRAEKMGYHFMRKMIKPAKLRALVSRLLVVSHDDAST
ncbi:response regulator [Corallincola holothuriorum]|uniref:histidine kinase n=1 Tax=Corallincola holothuriorum TaxID=2282215 RepID=A0A368N441_9GAMM|nr:PAS domain-containing hybrid sensor histidine kinase/response regulator [Corallincola holothuriorum]RCU45337.1 response regulator [Corallincola holothuriorum]